MPMKIRFFVVCLYCLFYFKPAFASGWHPEERKLLKTYHPPITDPIITSIKSNIAKIQFDRPVKEANKIRKHYIQTPHFKNGKIPYLLGEESGDQQKRPLLVYLGGSFSKLFSPITKNFHKRFIRLGYKVVSFENFICDCSVKRSPQFPFFDFKFQGMVYYEAIKEIHSDLLKKGKITDDIVLLGQSYGGFLGSIIFALDSEQKIPLFNRGLQAYSPPFDFVGTFEKLDHLLKEAKKDETFGNVPSYLMTAIQINRVEEDKDVTQRLKEKSLGVFIDFGLKKKLERTLIAFNDRVKSIELPEEIVARKRFLKELTFEEGLSLIDSKGYENLKLSQERYLSHWIFKAIENGQSNIRVLSSADDVINGALNPKLLNTNHLMLLPSGGHLGYKRLMWFDRLLIKVHSSQESPSIRGESASQ